MRGGLTWRAMHRTHEVTWTVCSNWQASDIKGTKSLPNLCKGRTHWKFLWKHTKHYWSCEPFDNQAKNCQKLGTDWNQLFQHSPNKLGFKIMKAGMLSHATSFLDKVDLELSSWTYFSIRNCLSGEYITAWMLTALCHRTEPSITSKVYLLRRALQHPGAPECL